jgi:glycosyltransferase involved in cell wall biosynthesis
MTIDQSSETSWQVPTRKDALSFWWRSTLLVAWHGLRNAISSKVKRWPAAQSLNAAPMLAQRRTPLWSDGRNDEFPLVAGKVHNLRVAIPAFHAIEIPADETFSFWAQLGQPTARRGFVEGREMREGCVVPTLAGGICQLSNALATVAYQAGLELVERHAHSARIEAAVSNDHADLIDATVFWNYIDLKLRASFAWRLEVQMTAEDLVVSIRAAAKSARKTIPLAQARATIAEATPVARGCLTCDQHQCFRHRPLHEQVKQGRTALLLDGWSPEFAYYLQQHWQNADYFTPMPWRLAFWRPSHIGRQAQDSGYRAKWASVRRALWQRLWARHAGGRRQASIIDGGRWLAQAYARHLRPEHTTLVVDQSLLPHLESSNALHGRRIVVLAHALPMQTIQARLDTAAQRWPQDASLSDYRAEATLMQAELEGLARAERIVTAHADVAAHMPSFTQAVIDHLTWAMPTAPSREDLASRTGTDMPIVAFPATALARKGIRELAAALHGLHCRLRVIGEPSTDRALFSGLSVEYISRDGQTLRTLLDGTAIVALPAHVEHQPRVLLSALARGIPVVATPACGIGERDNLHLVDAGDVDSLRKVLIGLIDAIGVSHGSAAPSISRLSCTQQCPD